MLFVQTTDPIRAVSAGRRRVLGRCPKIDKGARLGTCSWHISARGIFTGGFVTCGPRRVGINGREWEV